jgi:hypothetical protein
VCEDTEEWTLEESYGGTARSQAVRVVEREGAGGDVLWAAVVGKRERKKNTRGGR